ncbi:MAG TPA: spore coat U domain-containing protein [Steroidobacteraceae bacterium]|nr:spore coat U domain-containing protein [Steroidobacteraceae bacterium]
MDTSFGLLRAALTAALIVPLATVAQSPTTTFKVTTNVQASCQVSANDLNFGNYSPNAATRNDAQSELKVTCSPNVQYNIALNAGTSAGASIDTRKMTFGSSTLNYQLYRTSSRNSNEVWGDTVGSNTLQGNGTGTQQSYPVYGSVPAGQLVSPGTYIDTITVNVLF